MGYGKYKSLIIILFDKMKEGISFIVRIRDEEETLEESIRSLFVIQVPHEILLILHLCKDRSKEIAETLAKENPNIRIIEYLTPISRPGYEMLCTDVNSPHSIPSYYYWCYSQAKFPWKFKWDADFIATDSLINCINTNGWVEDKTKSHELYLNAVSPDNLINTERYLISGRYLFNKYYFWECIIIPEPNLTLYWDVNIIHKSKISNKKKYWEYTPWFLDIEYLKSHPEHYEEAIRVAKRYVHLIEICGPEPNGQARAMNPEDTPVFNKVVSNLETLKKFDIDPSI